MCFNCSFAKLLSSVNVTDYPAGITVAARATPAPLLATTDIALTTVPRGIMGITREIKVRTYITPPSGNCEHPHFTLSSGPHFLPTPTLYRTLHHPHMHTPAPPHLSNSLNPSRCVYIRWRRDVASPRPVPEQQDAAKPGAA